MDAITERMNNCQFFADNPVFTLHCCDLSYPFEFSIPSLPFLALNAVYLHFSLLNSDERRMCIVPYSETLLEKLNNIRSPCAIRVISSTIFKVRVLKKNNCILRSSYRTKKTDKRMCTCVV